MCTGLTRLKLCSLLHAINQSEDVYLRLRYTGYDFGFGEQHFISLVWWFSAAEPLHRCSCRGPFQQASAQPCYLLPTLPPWSPNPNVRRLPPAPPESVAAGHDGPPAAHTPARLTAAAAPHASADPAVPGRPGPPLPTSGLTPAVPHPAADPRGPAPAHPPPLQVRWAPRKAECPTCDLWPDVCSLRSSCE